jgi:hypothetical protein
MVTLTLEIPDNLAQSLERHPDQLTQILTLGLQALTADPTAGPTSLRDVLEFLATLPSPQEILELRLSPEVQTTIDRLLEQNRSGTWTEADRALWEHYEFVEHLVRHAKAQALIKLQQQV